MITSSTRFRNSGRKCRFNSAITLSSIADARLVGLAVHEIFLDDRRAEVAGHDDDGVLEIHRAALAVREPAVVEHLQQHVEHVVMRLLDFVEQHHRVRLAAHGLAELPAFLVADVARRRADEPRDGVLLHVFAHVYPDHRGLVVEEKFRQRAGRLGFAHAGRAEENKRADRAVRILQSAARTAHGIGHGGDRLLLPDDALPQTLLHLEQFFALAFEHPRNGNVRPRRDDFGDVLVGDFLPQ